MHNSGIDEIIELSNILTPIQSVTNGNSLNGQQITTLNSTIPLNNMEQIYNDNNENDIDHYILTLEPPTNIEQSQSTAYIQNDILELLNVWNLPQLHTLLQVNQIDLEALRGINEKETSELLMGQPLGTRIKFKNLLSKWKVSQGLQRIRCDDDNVENSVSSSNQINSSPCGNTTQETENISLKYILQQTPQGRSILKLAEQKISLSDHNRSILIDEIVTYYINHKIGFGVNECEAMAMQIESQFASETSTVYFIRRKKIKAKGQLYDRYNNRIAKLRSLLPTAKRHKSIEKEAGDIIDISTLNSTQPYDIRKLCEELKYNRDDTEMETILSKWKSTSAYRLKWMSSNKEKNLESTLNEWPAYTQAYGPRLIDIDFENLYPNADNVFIKFDKFCHNVLPIMETKIIEPMSKQLLKEFKLQKYITPDTRACITLHLLHALIKPTNKKRSRESKKILKYTIKDAQNSFMVLLASPNDVETYIKNQVNIKSMERKQLQPFIIIIGENLYSANQYFIYWDSIKYKFASALAAMDCVFKICQVFNLKYPTESEAVWQFIQKYFYHIETPFDDAFPSVNLLIKSLDNLQ